MNRAYTGRHATDGTAATMAPTLKQRVRRFMSAPRGTRFQARYQRLRQRPHVMRTILAGGLGLLLIAVGLVLLVLPGQGILVATIGAALIAGESLTLARLLDRLDVVLARWWARWRG